MCRAAAKRQVTVDFAAEVQPGLKWSFKPCQKSIKIRPGQSTLVFYTAENLSDDHITAVSTYNVAPPQVRIFNFDLRYSSIFYLKPVVSSEMSLLNWRALLLVLDLLFRPCVAFVPSDRVPGVDNNLGQSGGCSNIICKNSNICIPKLYIAVLYSHFHDHIRFPGITCCNEFQVTQVGYYFNKIQCFCFEEQHLRPREAVDMPVFFYIDPEFATDRRLKNVDHLTLSYVFFKTGEVPTMPDGSELTPGESMPEYLLPSRQGGARQNPGAPEIQQPAPGQEPAKDGIPVAGVLEPSAANTSRASVQ